MIAKKKLPQENGFKKCLRIRVCIFIDTKRTTNSGNAPVFLATMRLMKSLLFISIVALVTCFHTHIKGLSISICATPDDIVHFFSPQRQPLSLHAVGTFFKERVHINFDRPYTNHSTQISTEPCIEQLLSSLPHELNRHDYASLFDGLLTQGALTNQDILKQYQLYNRPEFVAYIQHFTHYDQQVQKIYAQLIGSKKERKRICAQIGLPLKQAQGLFLPLIDEIECRKKSFLEIACTKQESKAYEQYLNILHRITIVKTVINDQEACRALASLWPEVVLKHASTNTSMTCDADRITAAINDKNYVSRNYYLSSDAHIMLLDHKCTTTHYTRCWGNRAQHELQSAIITLIEACASSKYQNPDRFTQEITAVIIACLDKACLCAADGNIATTHLLILFCNQLFKYGQSLPIVPSADKASPELLAAAATLADQVHLSLLRSIHLHDNMENNSMHNCLTLLSSWHEASCKLLAPSKHAGLSEIVYDHATTCAVSLLEQLLSKAAKQIIHTGHAPTKKMVDAKLMHGGIIKKHCLA